MENVKRPNFGNLLHDGRNIDWREMCLKRIFSFQLVSCQSDQYDFCVVPNIVLARRGFTVNFGTWQVDLYKPNYDDKMLQQFFVWGVIKISLGEGIHKMSRLAPSLSKTFHVETEEMILPQPMGDQSGYIGFSWKKYNSWFRTIRKTVVANLINSVYLNIGRCRKRLNQSEAQQASWYIIHYTC